jgi:hypothetical protein
MLAAGAASDVVSKIALCNNSLRGFENPELTEHSK